MVVERVAQVLVTGLGNGDKGKGKEDLHGGRAKSVEDSSNKGEKPQGKPQEESVIMGEIRRLKTQGEIRGRESKYFNHLMKITTSRESRMILMHSTSKKKSKKK